MVMKVATKNYMSKTLLLLIVLMMLSLLIPSHVMAEQDYLEEFLIITESGMDLNEEFCGVEKGKICNRQPNEGIEVCGKVLMHDGTAIAPPGVVINCHGTTHKIHHIVGNHVGCNFDTWDPNPRLCPEDPPFPSEIIPGTEDVKVENERKTIDPGIYRDLILKGRAIVTLRGPGEYVFRRIIAKNGSKWIIYFEMDPICDPTVFITINVKEFVSLAEDGCFNPKIQADGSELPYGVEPIYLNIAGEDALYGGDNPCGDSYEVVHQMTSEYKRSVFCFKGDGQLNLCRVHAPEGTIRLAGRLYTNTQFLSEWFIKTRATGLPVQIGPMPPCCIPICPCIMYHTTLAEPEEWITVIGQGFSKEAIKKVLFFLAEPDFDSRQLDVDLDFPEEDADDESEEIIVESETKLLVKLPSGMLEGKYHVSIATGVFCSGPRAVSRLLTVE
jgi:hypothetical protein